MTVLPVDTWFLADAAAADSPVRVICFAHAGGNARHYLNWQERLGDGAQLLGVVPPGRGHRAAETPVASVAEYAEAAARAITATADRPTVLFGHSLGGLLAFEVARRLRDVPAVTDVVVSGCSAPSLLPTARVVAAARLRGREFVEAVTFFGGLPPELLEAEEIWGVVLPPVYLDFAMVAGYRYHRETPLRAALHLVNGIDDPHVSGDALRGWSDECVAPPTTTTAAGGHFYFDRDPDTLLTLLRRLAGTRRAAVPTRHHVELI